MLGIEELVGGEEREVHPRALVDIDPPPPGRRADRRVDPPPPRRRQLGQRRRQCGIDRRREVSVARADKGRTVLNDFGERRGAFRRGRGDGDHPRPRRRRLRQLAAALEALCGADQRVEVGRVERQRTVQRRALAGVVTRQPPRLGEVEPQRQPVRVERRRAFEQHRRRRRVAGVEPLQAGAVQGLRCVPHSRRYRIRCAVTKRIAATCMK